MSNKHPPAQLLGNHPFGRLFVLSAPAGTGKTTLIHRLTNEFPCIIRSISFTSRPPRPGEVDGVDYHFVTRLQFESKIASKDFLEYVELYGNYYGTSQEWVLSRLKEGKHVVLVIDTQGALQLRGKMEAVFIFVAPPSMESLQKRLMKRQTESPEAIQHRLEWARQEMEASTLYDYCLVNDDLDIASQVLRSIFIAEEHRSKRE